MNDDVPPPGGKPMVNQTALGRELALPKQYDDGLTKREYFAALAMQGLMANEEFSYDSCKAIAEKAVEQADELLAALAKE